MSNFLHGLSESELKAIAAIAQAVATIGSAVIVGIFGVTITSFFNRRRDREQREAWWRGHALELTKLDLERALKTRSPRSAEPLRPGVLDFLANYRDLQELGKLTPAELYTRIREKRINNPDDDVPEISVAWRKELLDVLATHPDQDAFIALWGRVVPEDRAWLDDIGSIATANRRSSRAVRRGVLSLLLGIAVGIAARRSFRR